MRTGTRNIALGGLFTAMGVLVPIIFHQFGAGAVFLPMHIPILLGGFFLGWPTALATGAITPLASSFFTGMPPIMPTALLMVVELAVLASVSSLCCRRLKLPVYASVLLAMAAARLAVALELIAAAPLLGIDLPPLTYLALSLARSWPGIVVQLIVVPPLVVAIHRIRL